MIIHDYDMDADEYVKLSNVRIIKKRYTNYGEKNGIDWYKNIAKELDPYLDIEEAENLWKEIQYKLGEKYLRTNDCNNAMICFEKADDYSGASAKLDEAKNMSDSLMLLILL